MLLCGALALTVSLPAAPAVLTPAVLHRHVAKFNAMEDEPIANLVPNAAAAWLRPNIPLFERPDVEVVEIYFFGWCARRKHLRRVLTIAASASKPTPAADATATKPDACSGGKRQRAEDVVDIWPLLPASTWDWFGLDEVAYHDRIVTIR